MFVFFFFFVKVNFLVFFFFFQAEDGIRDGHVTGVQTCALPIWSSPAAGARTGSGRTPCCARCSDWTRRCGSTGTGSASCASSSARSAWTASTGSGPLRTPSRPWRRSRSPPLGCGGSRCAAAEVRPVEPEPLEEPTMGPVPAVAAIRLAVRTALADHQPGALVLVACSGGADSLALACATAFVAPRLGLRCGGVSVDHGLQDGSP